MAISANTRRILLGVTFRIDSRLVRVTVIEDGGHRVWESS